MASGNEHRRGRPGVLMEQSMGRDAGLVRLTARVAESLGSE